MFVLFILAVVLGILAILTFIHILQTGIKGWAGKSIEDQMGKPAIELVYNDIKRLSKYKLTQLFYAAHPPKLNELNGEVKGKLAPVGAVFFMGSFFTYFIYGKTDTWIGKGFKKSNVSPSNGYNLFRSHKDKNEIIRKRKISTYIMESKLDNKPSYFLDYGPYNSGLVHLFRDELRKINDKLYIGVGYLTFPGGSIVNFPFFLYGEIVEKF